MLERTNAPKTYVEHSGKGSMGGDLKRLPGASQDELEEACNADAGCAGFTSEGWLKSALEPQDEWFDTNANLFVKTFEDGRGTALLQSRGDGDEEIDLGTPDS